VGGEESRKKMTSLLMQGEKSPSNIPTSPLGHPKKYITLTYQKLGEKAQTNTKEFIFHIMKSKILATKLFGRRIVDAPL